MRKRLLAILLVAAWSATGFAEDGAMTGQLKIDLAGFVRAGVVEPVDGITSAGQPDKAAFEVFAKSGYRTVIDLRGEGEDRGLDEAIEDADGPVLIHCGSENRVGALLALSESLEGGDDETALEYGRQGGMTGLQERVEEALKEK